MLTIDQTVLPAIGEDYRQRDGNRLFRLIEDLGDCLVLRSDTGAEWRIPPHYFWRDFMHASARIKRRSSCPSI